MKLSTPLVFGSGLAAALVQQQWPIHDNGLNEVVEWDHYSLIVEGQRMYMWSGEIHYWRIPVPELWIDILEKIKAAGFNTFSVYGHWGYHSPKDGVLDFETGAHNFTRLFDIAKDLGLYILFRPGPYVNAETSAGGFPGWLTTGEYGELRNNDTRYTEAWTPYFETMSRIVQKHSITNGGNVIIYQLENEFGEQWSDVEARTPNYAAIEYMELLEASARNSGIDTPLLHNNPNLNTKSWSRDYDINNVGGDVDLYSVDSYPSCWSCNTEECTSTNGFPPEFTVFDYYTHFQETAPTQPSILAEFQGGSYNPWNGPQGGCVNTTGPDWVNVFYRNNIGQKATGVNLYMLFGGTNWGGLPIPIVGTSYDYSAPISESRLMADKYAETKLLGFMLRAAKDLNKVEHGRNGTTALTGNPQVFSQELYNIDNGARFYVVKHTNTTLTSRETFRLQMTTSAGDLTVPKYGQDIAIDGREAKILVSDFNAGEQEILYSTAEVMAVSVQDDKPIIVFWVPTGESGEFHLRGVKHGSVAKCSGCANIGFYPDSEGLAVTFLQNAGSTVLTFDNGVKAVIMDRSTSYKTWQPMLSADPRAPLNQTVLVTGPYLVRNAAIEDGKLALTGDWNAATALEIFAPSVDGKTCTEVTFNGRRVSVQESSYGSLSGSLAASNVTIESITETLPDLSNWKVADGLRERYADYNDSGAAWVQADRNSTTNPQGPETYPVLYADEYGFHAQNVLWRGRFNGEASGAYLDVIGGVFSGWSAWLNGEFLGSTYGDADLSSTNLTLEFGNATRKGENVLFVLQDHMGHDLRAGALNPRGIMNATLLGSEESNFTSWKVAGTAGGEENIDPIRTPYNEGGLYAERLGWHLPGFDDSEWETGSPESGLQEAGAKFYRTVVPLEIPTGYDVSLAFELHAGEERSKLRAQLYVNGYMFGKFVPYVGNQVEYPVFPGILDYHGNNTIGLSVWNQDDQAQASVSVSMKVLGVYESSFDPGSFDTAYLRPGWSEERLQYA